MSASAAHNYRNAARHGQADEFPHEPGLADARLAHDHRAPSTAGESFVERALERSHLVIPADEHGAQHFGTHANRVPQCGSPGGPMSCPGASPKAV